MGQYVKRESGNADVSEVPMREQLVFTKQWMSELDFRLEVDF